MNRVHEDSHPPVQKPQWASFLSRPPADTWVTLCSIADPSELDWIEQHCLLPIPVDRATQDPHFDPQVLTAELVLAYSAGGTVTLFRVIGTPVLFNRGTLLDLGYAGRGSQFYYCLRLEALAATSWADQLPLESLARLRERLRPGIDPAIPVTVTWWDLAVGGR